MFTQGSEGTSLSAEVPPFVPRRAWSDEQGSAHPSTLPHYVTTCYPFVQEQQDRRQMNSPSNLQSLQSNHNPLWPPQNLFAPAVINPNFLAGRPFSQNLGILRYSGVQGNIADTAQSNAVYSTVLQSSHNSSKQHNSSKSSSTSSKNEDKQGKKIMKKHVGVQKEAASDTDTELPVMVDSSQQTDFPSSISSKSLTDKPSPLKKIKSRQVKSRANDSPGSSDHTDAEVDSDSGYCSPKRRLKKNGGTNTDFLNNNQAGNALHPFMLFDPRNISPFLYSSSSQLHPNFLPPHVSSPNPSSASVMRYPPLDAPVLLGPTPSAMNHASIASRPPPGFPLPPGMLKTHDPMTMSDGWVWNGPRFPSNYPPGHPNFRHHRPIGTKPPGPNTFNPNKKQPKLYPQSSTNQGFQKKNRKYDNRYVGSRGAGQAEPVRKGEIATETLDTSSNIFLQDVSEFPGLGGDSFSQHRAFNNNKLSYSHALSHPPPVKPPHTSPPQSSRSTDALQDSSQKSRKRMKKAERASKAADEEYAEISREQENIKKALKKTANSRNRKQQPSLDLGEIFSKLEAKRSSKIVNHNPNKKSVHVGGGVSKSATRGSTKHKSKSSLGGANLLDSSRPTVRRGKEREVPKVKKPSALKKVILKEREEKKEQRLQQLTTLDCPDHDVPPFPSAILQPTASSTNKEEISTNLAQLTIDDVPPTIPQIHSRRYREYCCQVLDKKIDETCTHILQKLVLFQERMYQRDPVKAKMKRRLVMGIREVTKHLKLKKLKCVIISPNLEKIQSKGGLDDALQQILDICEEQNVTYIFALGRKAMGRAVSKLVPVSIVGIFDYSGVDEHYKTLMSLVSDAQKEYKEMVSVYQQEVIKANVPSASASGAAPKRFTHMTHSRNPSAASCVSFASFISEPISELNEDSNWRVLMDAGEEPSLSPTAEAEYDEDLEDSVKEIEELGRKDSESTVVECKIISEQPLEPVSEHSRPSSEDDSISEDSSEYEDATSHTSNHQESSFPKSSQLEANAILEAVPGDGSSPESPYPNATLMDALEESTSEDRIHMWLEDSQSSMSISKQNESVDLSENKDDPQKS